MHTAHGDAHPPPSLAPQVPQRCWRKLIVPIEKYPGYNFFGAIIGPRGNAQKRMEKESGCKIVVRGKGAIKDGCARHDGKPLGPEDEEPMHVLIEGCVRVGFGQSDPPTPYAARWRRSVGPLPLPHPAGPTRRASRRGRRSWRLSSTRALAPRKWLSGGLGAVADHRLAAPSHTLPDESPPPRCLLLPLSSPPRARLQVQR